MITTECTRVDREKIKLTHLLRNSSASDLNMLSEVSDGNRGMIVSKSTRKERNKQQLLVDLDDTLIATEASKRIRMQNFGAFFAKYDIQIDPEIVKQLMDMTDKFARWQEVEGGWVTYFKQAHMAALSWASQEIIKTGKKQVTEVPPHIINTLRRISDQRTGMSLSEKDDPFYFQIGQKPRFILKQKLPWLQAIEDVFWQPMVTEVEKYQDMIEACLLLQHIGIEIGIFTSGSPDYQLTKCLELLCQTPRLNISRIFLSKAETKGQFLSALLAEGITDHFPTESMVLVDDSAGETHSAKMLGPALLADHGVRFKVARNTRMHTKEWQKPDKSEPDLHINFITEEWTPERVAQALLRLF